MGDAPMRDRVGVGALTFKLLALDMGVRVPAQSLIGASPYIYIYIYILDMGLSAPTQSLIWV